MGLTKSTADAYRIWAPAISALAPASFICAWAKFAALTDLATLFDDLLSKTSGRRLRIQNGAGVGDDLLWLYPTAGANVSAIHVGHGISAGEWAFWFGGVDALGNWVVGVNGTETTAAGPAPQVAAPTGAATLLHTLAGTVGHEGLATLGGVWCYSRLPALAERQTMYHLQGRRMPRNGLVSELLCWDAAPGVTTATVVPRDSADPSRVWSEIGAGDAYTWAEAPYPRSR